MTIRIEDLAHEVGAVDGRSRVALRGVRRAITIAPSGTAQTWTTMPLALTAYLGAAGVTAVILADLWPYTEARLLANVSVAGTAAAVLDARWNETASATAAAYKTLSIGTNQVSLAATGVVATSWFKIRENARGDVYLAIFGAGGDGIESPALTWLELQLRA